MNRIKKLFIQKQKSRAHKTKYESTFKPKKEKKERNRKFAKHPQVK